MPRFSRIPAALVFITLIMGCSSGTSEADLQSLTDFVAQYDAAVNAGDVAALMALYSDSAIQMPPNEPLIHGKVALRSRAEEGFAMNNAELRSNVEYVRVTGNTVFMRLSYVESITPKAGGETLSAKGKWVLIIRRTTEGSWVITNEIWNEDAPPIAP